LEIRRTSCTLEKSIGVLIRDRRKKQGKTVAALAAQSGLSIGMVSKIENGATSASLATLQRVAQALNVPIGSFLPSLTTFEMRPNRAGKGTS